MHGLVTSVVASMTERNVRPKVLGHSVLAAVVCGGGVGGGGGGGVGGGGVSGGGGDAPSMRGRLSVGDQTPPTPKCM